MPTPLSPPFPEEIFIKVIEHLADPFHETERVHPWDKEGRSSKKALMQCRLVCRSFCDAASNHLFKEVHLDGEDEEDDTYRSGFLELIKAPQGGILRHVEYLAFQAPNLMWRHEFTHQDTCRWLAFLLDKVLDLHHTLSTTANARPFRLQTLDIYFSRNEHGATYEWSLLTKKLRASITSVCCKLPLDTLDIMDIDGVPPELFEHLQAKRLVLSVFTPLPKNVIQPASAIRFPQGPLLPSALKSLVTDSPAWIPCTIQEFTFVGGWDACDPRLITHHAPTLEKLRFSGISSARTSTRDYPPIKSILNKTTFPRLETFYFIDSVHYNFKANPEGRHGSGSEDSPFHYHPDTLLDTLQPFTALDKAPQLQKIDIELSLEIDSKHAQGRSRCLWDYSGCSVADDDGPPCSAVRWSDFDNFLHTLLTTRRDKGLPLVAVRIHFNVQIHYRKGDPSTIALGCFRKEEIYWRERGWPTSTAPAILPRVVESFRDVLTFDSSFDVLPSPFEEMDSDDEDFMF